MAQQTIIFDVHSLLRLMTHYSQDSPAQLPLDSEIAAVARHEKLHQYIGLWVRSKEWDSPEPFHFRYQGRRTMTWNEKGTDPFWTLEGQVEAPRRG